MLPGLIIPNNNNNETINLYTFKHINKNELYSLCLNGNDAPIAIGITWLSGEDMYMSGMRDKCLNILHLHYTYIVQVIRRYEYTRVDFVKSHKVGTKYKVLSTKQRIF